MLYISLLSLQVIVISFALHVMGRRKMKKNKDTKMKGSDTEIAYQNKDITSKVMAEEFEGESFAVYGVDLPKIVRVEPTNLPAIEANELRMDNLFYLEDDSYLIVDYESEYDYSNMLKYMGYVVRVSKRLYNEIGKVPKIGMLVIYTADVERGTTNPYVEAGCFRFEVTEAFLSDLDTKEIWLRIKGKINSAEALSSREKMELIVYPLAFKTQKGKRNAVDEVITLTEKLQDDKQKVFALKCLAVFADKIMSDKEAKRIKEALMMTKVDKLIYEDVATQIAEKFLKSGTSVDVVAENTGLPIEKVVKLNKKIHPEKK